MEPEDLREQLKNTPFEQLQPRVLQKLAEYQPVEPGILKVVPFLQALVDFAPSPTGQHGIAVDILSCPTSLCLENLAKQYWEGLIVPIRANGGKTPPLSDHFTQKPEDSGVSVDAWLLEPSKCDRRTMRKLVLHRENYRCSVTGRVDANSIEDSKTEIQHGAIPSTVENAHILPFSLVHAPKGNNTSSIWQLIKAFSGISLDELNGDYINRPENGIALDHTLYGWFADFSLCFGATLEPDTYTVHYWNHALGWGLPSTASFVSRSGVPVPDSRYLAFHAACAKVVRSSGMDKILNELIEDLEHRNVLSSDGSSAHLLHNALGMIARQ
ncbi:hypothetical protein FRC01_002201 [Tulasnella sp. 417]|nr:hypothetical protein FRC01_002201 [Tulasnella sp. 417]